MTATGAAKPRGGWRKLLRFGLGVMLPITIIAVVFGWLLPRAVDYDAVWHTLLGLNPWALAGLVALALIRLLPGAWLDSTLVPGLRLLSALRAWLGAQATLLMAPSPADVVVRFAVYRSVGVPLDRAATGLAMVGVAGYVARLGLPVLVAAVFVAMGAGTPTLQTIAYLGSFGFLFGGVLVWLALSSDSLARAFGRLLTRASRPVSRLFRRRPAEGLEDRVADAARDAREVIGTRWDTVVVAILAMVVTDFTLFVACFHAVGLPAGLSTADLLLGFATMWLVMTLPISPGGIGLVEPAVIAMLASLSSSGDTTNIAAGVFLYRVLSLFLPMVLGLAPLLAWWRRRRFLTQPAPAPVSD